MNARPVQPLRLRACQRCDALHTRVWGVVMPDLHVARMHLCRRCALEMLYERCLIDGHATVTDKRNVNGAYRTAQDGLQVARRLLERLRATGGMTIAQAEVDLGVSWGSAVATLGALRRAGLAERCGDVWRAA